MNERMGRAAEVSRTPARRKFQGYKQDTPRRIRMPDVRKDSVPELVEAYRRLKQRNSLVTDIVDDDYGWVFLRLWEMRLEYSAKDVEKLSVLIPQLVEMNPGIDAGFFFTALINLGKEESYVLHVVPSLNPRHMGHVGFRSKKSIEIFGDAGGDLGAELMGGRIVLNGNFYCPVGSRMISGEIHLNGEPLEDDEIAIKKGQRPKILPTAGFAPQGGKIFHNGKLVFDK
jgi:hypothetical protein